MIDEARHALSTQAGIDAMFALKAGRDSLNQGVEQQGLYVVLTGSNRDKLAQVAVTSVQAALDALRDKGLVWRAAYGDYALEDESLAAWHQTQREAEMQPPRHDEACSLFMSATGIAC